MREGLNRRWLALVLVAFCVPLFVGLGLTDLDNDEAIYSYAVDSILDTGDWLSPRSSPNERIVFLEKPPLKFWIVAAPIRLGLLPHDEFGLRFWDAVFGSLAFIYVFLIGRRLAGPVCGAVGVLVLFAQPNLVFDHGLRSNDMDAAIVLAYCGGVYHYLRYVGQDEPRRARHVAAMVALFVLGFMTKFVAALFLPVVIGAAALAVSGHRRLIARDWRTWGAASVAVLALVVPWFAYQHVASDGMIWRVMIGDHVYTRFTAYTDPSHLKPWHFYFAETFLEFQRSSCTLLVVFGLIVLAVDSVRRRLHIGFVLLLWFLPLGLISAGTSKLYHYAYPFLPPLALAGGYGAAWIVRHVASWFSRLLDSRRLRIPQPTSASVRASLLAIALVALGLAVVTAAQGQFRLVLDGHVLFRNSSVGRPLVTAVVCAALAGRLPVAIGGLTVLAVGLLLPLPHTGYLKGLAKLTAGPHPLRSLSACLAGVDATRRAAGVPVLGTYGLSTADPVFNHKYVYYLRRAGGWHEQRSGDDDALERALFVRGEERPVVISGTQYAAFFERRPRGDAASPRGVSISSIIVLLPGPYERCSLAMYER